MRRAAPLFSLALAIGCDDLPRRPDIAARQVVLHQRIMEERDGLWLLESDGDRRRITTHDVAGFDYATLAARQEEGRVILYWAAAPVASPDGELVAYASNREAVAADTSGQSIWTVDLGTGEERALLARPGRSLRPVGWLGDDIVVYIGDMAGVHGVDIRTGRSALLDSGTFLAAAQDGSALAVAHGVPETVRVRVLTRQGRVAVPPPPPGFEYLAQARFTDDGRRLLLEAAADSGRTRLPLAYDVATRRVTRLAPKQGFNPGE